ncbi:MAG: DUF2274 domain-containing protein [Pseudacidovorax sp.]|nr:DUF2274 domain-containing protein [Pseudacidovorax sp.]
MTSARKLRLGPLPKADSVKVMFLCPTELKDDLERYAALHSQTYGEKVDATALIPHMLQAFINRDRVFKRTRGRCAAPASIDSVRGHGAKDVQGAGLAGAAVAVTTTEAVLSVSSKC